MNNATPISDDELVAHIAECHLLMQLARARHRGSDSPQDAAEAKRWSECKDAAIKARQQAHRERQAAILEDEQVFCGSWTEQIGARYDVNPAAVRRRTAGGSLGR